MIDDLRLKARIRYFAALREITSLREETLEIGEGTTVLGILNLLVN